MATTSVTAGSKPAPALTATDVAFSALVVLPLALVAAALTLPIVAVALTIALPPLLLWRFTGWRLLRLLACLPAGYEVAWYRLHDLDPRPLSGAYLATQQAGAGVLLARLQGADWPSVQPALTSWVAASTPLALFLGSLLAVALSAFPPAFLRRPGHGSPEGERNRPAGERTPGNARPPHAGQAPGNALSLRNAAQVLYDLDHRRGQQRVRLAGDHFTVGAVSMMHGPSGVGKSRWLGEVVRALVRGEPVFGWPTVQTPVVWVTEEALAVWRDKAALLVREEEGHLHWWQRWARHRWPRRYPPAVWPLSLPDLGLEPTAETFPALVQMVEQLVRRTGAKLVIFDTLMAVCPQAVKDNEIAKVFIRQCAGLATRRKVAVEIVHHDNDGGTPLGAKMLKGAVDYTHHVFQPEDAEDDRLREVAFGKRYEPYPPPPLYYRMRDDGRLEAVDEAGRAAGRMDRGAGRPPTHGERDGSGRVGAAQADSGTAVTRPHDGNTAADAADAATLLALPAPPSDEERVLAVVQRMSAADGYATIPQIRVVTDLPKTTVWKRLTALERRGIVACVQPGGSTTPARWALTPADGSDGEAAAAADRVG